MSWECPVCHRLNVNDVQTMPCVECGWQSRAAVTAELAHLRYMSRRLEEWQAEGLLPAEPFAVLSQQVTVEIESREANLGRRRLAAEAAASLSGTDAQTGVALPSFPLRSVGTYLLSERILSALLFLGAFLVLSFGAVISAFNSIHLTPQAHLAVVFATALVFYGLGYVILKQTRLAKAGTALLMAGEAFVPLAIWTAGQGALLNWPFTTRWFVGSVVCVLVYGAIYLWIDNRGVATLFSLALGSLLLATFPFAGASVEWGESALILMAIIYLLAFALLPERWTNLRWSSFLIAQVTIPAAMAVLFVEALTPGLWQGVWGTLPPDGLDYAYDAAWWGGAVYYFLATKVCRTRAYQILALCVIPVALLLTLSKAQVSVQWLSLPLAMLSLAYTAVNWRSREAWRRTGQGPSFLSVADQPLVHTAFALGVFAVFWPVTNPASQALTLCVLTLTSGLAAWLYGNILLRYGFALAALLAFYLSCREWLSALSGDWPNASFAAIGGIYIAASYWLSRGYDKRPQVGSVPGEPFYHSGLLVMLIAMLWPSRLAANYLVAFCLMAVVFGIIALLSKQRPEAYISLGATLVSAYLLWQVTHLHPSVQPLAWTVIAVTFCVLAEAAARRTGDHRHSLWEVLSGTGRWRSSFASALWFYGYAVALWAIAVALWSLAWHRERLDLATGDYWLHVGAFAVVAILFALSGLIRQSRVLSSVATGAFLIPYALTARAVPWRPTEKTAFYGLAIACLAPAYVGLGVAQGKRAAKLRWPYWFAGYILSVAGGLLALGDRDLAIAALAIAFGLYLGSAIRFHRAEWIYPAALVPPAELALILVRSGAPLSLFALALMTLALGYVVVFSLLQQRDPKRILDPARVPYSPYALPFLVVGYVLSAAMITVLFFSYLDYLGSSSSTASQPIRAWGDWTIVATLLLAAVQYLYGAVIFRRGFLNYVTVCLTAIAWAIGLSTVGVPFEIYAAAFLPFPLLSLGLAEALRRRVDKREQRTPLAQWGAPFYAMAYLAGGVALLVALPSGNTWTLTLAGLGAMALSALSVVSFREKT